MASAFIGKPPATQDDYWIIKGMLRMVFGPGVPLDPNKGFPLLLQRPANNHYQSRGTRLLIGSSFAIVLIILVTGTRLWLRFSRRELRWGPDDFVIVPGVIGVLAWFSCLMAMVTYAGLGKHYYDITYREAYWSVLLGAVDQTLFWVSLGLIKISITLFNRRLTGATSESWIMFHNVFFVLLICYIVAALFVNLFRCRPPAAHYSLIAAGQPSTIPHCLSERAISLPLSVVHIIFDFALLSVPIIVLIKVQMSFAKKVRLMFLFSVGSVSCIGSVMRQISSDKSVLDITWELPIQISWSIIDIFFATITASLPVLNTLLPKQPVVESYSFPSFVVKESALTSRESAKAESAQTDSTHGSDQTELIYQPADGFPSKERVPTKLPWEEWKDPATLAQDPKPTHRDKLYTMNTSETPV